MADHLVEPALIRSLITGGNGRCALAVDHAHPGDPRADEATRADVRGGLVVDLGKALTDWNALDTGVFWCTPAVFDAFTPQMINGECGAVFASLARTGRLDAVDVTGMRWMDVDTPADLAVAESWIYGDARRRRLIGWRQPSKDPVSRYMNRRVSVPVARALAHTPLTPNQVSVVRAS